MLRRHLLLTFTVIGLCLPLLLGAKSPPPAKQSPPPAKKANPLPKPGKAKSSSTSAEELPLTWQGASISAAIGTAGAQKKVAFVYFYFQDKDDFPINYDDTLQRYSDERAIFGRVFVRTDSKGKITDPETDKFFTEHKLGRAATAVMLDQYGNFLSVMPGPFASNKITAAIDAADKQSADIDADFNKRYDKADKLVKDKKTPEMIKLLQQIVDDKYKGYPAIDKSRDKLAELDKAALAEHNDIIKAYHEIPEDDREPEETIKKLEPLAKTYKGLPAEKVMQESIALLKKGELPPLPVVEPPKEEPKKEVSPAPAPEGQESTPPAPDNPAPDKK